MTWEFLLAIFAPALLLIARDIGGYYYARQKWINEGKFSIEPEFDVKLFYATLALAALSVLAGIAGVALPQPGGS